MYSENLALFDEPGLILPPPAVNDPESLGVADRIIKTNKGFTPYPYQDEAVRAVLGEFGRGIQGTLLVSATGTGKMVMGAMTADSCISANMKVLWVAHREELTADAINTMRRQGLRVGLEKAEQRARKDFERGKIDVVVTTPQTYGGSRMDTWKPSDFALIIIDEAHHAIAASYRRIIAHHPAAKLMGMTATPYRLDGMNLGTVFQTKAYEYGIAKAIDEGFLVPVVARKLEPVPPIDLRSLNARSGDFNPHELDEIIQGNLGSICNIIRQTRYDGRGLADRPAIFFVPNVGSAESLAAGLKSIGITAEYVSCYCRNRTQKVENFRRGHYQVLVNAMLLTEGANFPFVSCVGLLRPTKSTSLVSQMIGRGTRLPNGHPLAEGKKDCLVLDFAWLYGEHDICHTADIYNDGSLDKQTLERVRQIVDEGEDNVQKALEQAKQERDAAEQEQAEAMRLAIRQRDVKFKSTITNPLSMAESMGIKSIGKNPNSRPAPNWLVDSLRELKVPNAHTLTYDDGMRIRDYLVRRQKKGLATHKQVGYLEALGFPTSKAKRMSVKEAAAKIDELKTQKEKLSGNQS